MFQSDDQMNRATGRTTMLALHFVQLVLDNPGQWIQMDDHHQSINGDRHLFYLVCNVLHALNVPFDKNVSTISVMARGPRGGPYIYPDLKTATMKAMADDWDSRRFGSFKL